MSRYASDEHGPLYVAEILVNAASLREAKDNSHRPNPYTRRYVRRATPEDVARIRGERP